MSGNKSDTHGDMPPADLSKREYFAAMAMQGLLAGDPDAILHTSRLATDAVAAADALLDALETKA